MNTTKEIQQLQAIIPLFIVDDVSLTIRFYTDKLGFSVHFEQTLPDDDGPSFCILGRDGISIMFKSIVPGISAKPNSASHEWARWDAYISTKDPDTLFDELRANGIEFHRELENTDDGLRAFEVRDNNGYVLCFAKLNQ